MPEQIANPDGHGRARAEQTAVAVVALAAFVFRTPWLVGFLAAVLALGLASSGRLSLVLRAYDEIARRRGRPPAGPPGDEQRFAEWFGLGVVALALLAFGLGVASFGWAFTLAAALVAALHAAAGISLPSALYQRVARARDRN